MNYPSITKNENTSDQFVLAELLPNVNTIVTELEIIHATRMKFLLRPKHADNHSVSRDLAHGTPIVKEPVVALRMNDDIRSMTKRKPHAG